MTFTFVQRKKPVCVQKKEGHQVNTKKHIQLLSEFEYDVISRNKDKFFTWVLI